MLRTMIDMSEGLVTDLGLEARTERVLYNLGITTVADLTAYTEENLLRLDGIGFKRVKIIKAALAAHNLSLTL